MLGGAAVAVLGAPVLLGAAGFTTAGVAAGSLAAWMQTATTVSGSAFSVLQSVGAGGALTGSMAKAVLATTGAGVGYLFGEKQCGSAQNEQSSN
ncbi:uncharacterized protein LOC142354265 [Convolutriloba macropyga]|uniref:uncharacterized protein LOC142354265 n=1 Tax=Convolutriloba macropyga TaxID=536237 RepID=UPI003F51CF5C